MPTNWSTDDLIAIVAAGGGIRISATRIGAADLKRIAAGMVDGSRLIVTQCGRLSARDALEIVSMAAGLVLFDD